jgi:hypothetical protein
MSRRGARLLRRAAIAALLAAGCGTTRRFEVPPPYDDHGIFVTVKPCVEVGFFGFETIRGTMQNLTGRDVDLHLFLNLVDEKGAVVGYAHAFNCLRSGEKQCFEAFSMPGQPRLFPFPVLAQPPRWRRVERGFVYDDRTLLGHVVYWSAVVWLVTASRP